MPWVSRGRGLEYVYHGKDARTLRTLLVATRTGIEHRATARRTAMSHRLPLITLIEQTQARAAMRVHGMMGRVDSRSDRITLAILLHVHRNVFQPSVVLAIPSIHPSIHPSIYIISVPHRLHTPASGRERSPYCYYLNFALVTRQILRSLRKPQTIARATPLHVHLQSTQPDSDFPPPPATTKPALPSAQSTVAKVTAGSCRLYFNATDIGVMCSSVADDDRPDGLSMS
ncbi:uncharacterized protein LOC107266246 [Cephus cinctus]|uniref:Uncharacterized protein LOC107266246 n=1 Tax=Cephus cinctus TaxID=211228 RepID=A0AAJ7W093_CEPCN|nr:uncharacterized protein LOC107266246 [Cephus cinctus]